MKINPQNSRHETHPWLYLRPIIRVAVCVVGVMSVFSFWFGRTSAQSPAPTATPAPFTIAVRPEASYTDLVTARAVDSTDLVIRQTASFDHGMVFEFTLDPASSVDHGPTIEFNAPGHLACVLKLYSALQGSTVILKAGDINNDGLIDDRDIGAFNANQPSGAEVADINQDAQVDIRDLTYIGRHYGAQAGPCVIELAQVPVVPTVIDLAASTPTATSVVEPVSEKSLTPTATPVVKPSGEESSTATPPLTLTPTSPPAATPSYTPNAVPGSGPVVGPTAALDGSPVLEAESDAVTRLGKWTVHDTSVASGGRYIFSSGVVGDALVIPFSGTNIAISVVKHAALGTFGIEIDGVLLTTVVETSEETVFGALVTVDNLNPGPHLLLIRAAEGTVALDAFLVRDTVVAPDVASSNPAPTQTPESLSSPTPTAEVALTLEATSAATIAAPITPTTPPVSTMVSLPVSENFDSGSTWTPMGSWTLDGKTAHSGMSWFASSAARGQSSVLTADYTIDLRAALYPQLVFWQKMTLSRGDAVGIDLSLDGNPVWLLFDTQPGSVMDWTLHTLDLSAYQGHVIRVRWRLETVGAVPDNEFSVGYWLDDLAVIDGVPVTASATVTCTPIIAPPPSETPVITATNPLVVPPTETPLPTATVPPTIPPTALPTEPPLSIEPPASLD